MTMRPDDVGPAGEGADPPFWERPDTVAWFAQRPPDPRVAKQRVLPPGGELLLTHFSSNGGPEGDAHRIILDGHYRRHPLGSTPPHTKET